MSTGLRTLILVGAVGLTLGACASSASQPQRTDRNRLTSEELASVETLNLYEAISRLRPRWLEVRAPRSAFGGGLDEGVIVFLDRTRIGGVEELKRFGPREVAWVEYMTGTEAAAALPGIQHTNAEGAIVVHTRAPDDR